MKKNKNNKNQISNESNRGRPKKSFVSRKPKIKREGPGRPRKIDINENKIKLPTPAEENKLKDTIILIMFIISLLIFCFSIYISQTKKQEEKALLGELTTTLTNTGNTQTGTVLTGNNIPETNTNSGDTVQNTAPSQIDTQIQSNNETEILEKFYTTINQQRFLDMYPLIENGLKQSNIFRTYFSQKRLQRFLNNIENNTLKYTIKTTEIGTTTTIYYTITYTLKNGSGYSEDRSASLINKDNTFKIAKLMCQTPGCSKMPFFNPGKYNIK